jgi:hypothetical protein
MGTLQEMTGLPAWAHVVLVLLATTGTLGGAWIRAHYAARREEIRVRGLGVAVLDTTSRDRAEVVRAWTTGRKVKR